MPTDIELFHQVMYKESPTEIPRARGAKPSHLAVQAKQAEPGKARPM